MYSKYKIRDVTDPTFSDPAGSGSEFLDPDPIVKL